MSRVYHSNVEDNCRYCGLPLARDEDGGRYCPDRDCVILDNHNARVYGSDDFDEEADANDKD